MSEISKRLGIVEAPKQENAEGNGDEQAKVVAAPVVDEGKPVEEKKVEAPTAQPQSTPTAVDEDAIALAVLNRRHNANFATLDEAYEAISKPKTAEDAAAQKEKREQEKLKFALDTGKFSKDTYEKYLVAKNKEARDIVFEKFYKERKAQGDSDASIAKKFAKLHGEDLSVEEDADEEEKAEVAFLKEQHQARMQKEAAKILKNNFPSIYQLDKEYETHEATVKSNAAKQQRLQANRNAYTKDLTDIINTQKSEKIKFGDEAKPETLFETEFTYPDEVLNQVKSEFTHEAAMSKFIENYDKDMLQTMIKLRLKDLTQSNIIEHTAKRYYSTLEAKRLEERKELTPTITVGGQTVNPIGGEVARRLGLTKTTDSTVN